MTGSAFARPGLIANLASNFANVGVLALITLVATPLYVHALGSAWNEVALCLTIQGLVFLLDAAVSPLMLRDVARAHRAGQGSAGYRRFVRLYLGIGILVFAIGEIATILVATLRFETAPLAADLRRALHLIFVQFLFQFWNNAAIGYWNATDQQQRANTRLTVFTLTKHALALPSVLVWHTATAYVLPFALVSAVECWANHRRLRAERVTPLVAHGNGDDWRDIGRYGFATALGLATTQVDRWYLCVALPADRYGAYYLASSFMLSIFSLQAPIIRAFLPRIATAEFPDADAGLLRRLLLVTIGLPSLALAAFAHAALAFWLHDAAIADAAAPTFRLLMFVVAMNAFFAPTNVLLLHRHRYRQITAINATILVAQLCALTLLTSRIGMLAGAGAWLAWGLIQLACAGYHSRLASPR